MLKGVQEEFKMVKTQVQKLVWVIGAEPVHPLSDRADIDSLELAGLKIYGWRMGY